MKRIATRLGAPAYRNAPERITAPVPMADWLAGKGEDADCPEPMTLRMLVVGVLATALALAALGLMIFAIGG